MPSSVVEEGEEGAGWVQGKQEGEELALSQVRSQTS